MAAYRMTPARRAALRKAQLTSARKRRKTSAVSQGRKQFSQKRQYHAANRQLKQVNVRRHKVIRATAVGVGVGTAVVLGASIAGSRRPTASNRASRPPIKVQSQRVFGQPTRALTTGPKGKSAIRSRKYRSRQSLKKAGLYRVNPRVDLNPG